jgi:UDP-N-acetyl-D-glucosamine dehydrogenase
MEQTKNYELKKVSVIGLGYVGLPLAVRCQERGYEVIGVDIDEAKMALLKSGVNPFQDDYLEENFSLFPLSVLTSDAEGIKDADIHIIAVPTPVDERHHPDLGPVISASEMVAQNTKKGALVILESTVNPYVSEEIVKPIFEKYGFTIGEDLYISHCPERINPGDPKWNVTNIPRVVGSFDATGLAMSVQFYTSIVDAEIRPMKHIREAEAVKILENSFRNVNLAFVNEIAMSFDMMGIDVKDVIDGAATKPFAFMAHYPSCGVGGHCIPVDPHYLVERAKESGFDHDFLKLAIRTNNGMPTYTLERLQDALNEMELPMKGMTVGVLGLSYKAGVADLRESPALEIIKELKDRFKSNVETFDPLLLDLSSSKSLEELLSKSDALVLATNHREFIEALTPEMLVSNNIKAIVDGKNCLNRDAFMAHGDQFIYRGIGR